MHINETREGFDTPLTLPSGRPTPAAPKAARELVDHAHKHGWKTLISWLEDTEGTPYLVVQVGAKPGHRYTASWRNPDQPHGRLRLSGPVTGCTPTTREWVRVSLREVHGDITAHPNT